MDEQKKFFSDSHNRLLNIAFTARNIAWIVLVVFILYGTGTYFREQINQMFSRGFPNSYVFFLDLLTKQPLYALGLLAEIISIFLKGVIYFLVLKSISLGLSMIVETDINYREAGKERGVE